MDYRKVDAGLAAVLDRTLSSDDSVLDIFINLEAPLTGVEVIQLQGLGIRDPKQGQKILTAKVSPKQVSQLTDQSYVRYLRLAQKLRTY